MNIILLILVKEIKNLMRKGSYVSWSSNLIHTADSINCFAFFQENIQTIQILLKKYGKCQ